jgi:ATP-dependent Clp protease ATP-binding subunit ClpC
MFTPRSQQVLANASNEAKRLRHAFVGTEHLLLGLLKLGQGTASTALKQLGLNFDAVRAEVERLLGIGPELETKGSIPYTPRVKKIFVLAAAEARSLNHTYIGTEHILLGLLMETEGVAARVIKDHGIDTERTRNEILKVLNPDKDQASDKKALLE